MAGRKAHFFEPWVARKDSTWDLAFRGPGPQFLGVEPEKAQELRENYEAAKQRAERDADAILWGSGLCKPSATVGPLSGEPLFHDGSGIVARVRKLGLVPKGSPDHGDVAARVAACINACAGIANPEGFMADLRALLLAMSRGETDRGDIRVASLLSRCIPPGELTGAESCFESD